MRLAMGRKVSGGDGISDGGQMLDEGKLARLSEGGDPLPPHHTATPPPTHTRSLLVTSRTHWRWLSIVLFLSMRI
jgi:hypothetical protein